MTANSDRVFRPLSTEAPDRPSRVGAEDRQPAIKRIIVTGFEWTVADLALERKLGFDWVYQPGETLRLTGAVTQIETNVGVVGEAPGGIDARTARYLLGRNPLERDIIWHDLKRAERLGTCAPSGTADIALWDIAGKLQGQPIYRLLGGWRTRLPCYASTFHADEQPDGLSSPEAFAQYALACRDEAGYPAFKVHGWIEGPVSRETQTLLAVRQAVGDTMDLMVDPAGTLRTFADVLRVGSACDEAKYFWYEDPFRGGGFSQYAHAKLRGMIRTPILMGEHIRSLEAKADLIASHATDYVRACAAMDGGITGVMKIAALAESFGLDVELHGPSLAHRHCMAAIRNTNYYELGLVHPRIKGSISPPIYEDSIWLERYDSVVAGHVLVPQGNGLGVDIDWDYLNAHQTGVVHYE